MVLPPIGLNHRENGVGSDCRTLAFNESVSRAWCGSNNALSFRNSDTAETDRLSETFADTRLLSVGCAPHDKATKSQGLRRPVRTRAFPPYNYRCCWRIR